ncbi:hypothetical protein [Clostridium sp. CF012]|uniref:hypothetical protein n=1 Tax=Clostridium sp. CF012 TaxID=2843319 RepID=UPI001C0DA6B0|nr:hypothetical protein [Clostridium sp. CF012]MBU3143348.1 hypothetical protein [Clostridium sp. CF012]
MKKTNILTLVLSVVILGGAFINIVTSAKTVTPLKPDIITVSPNRVDPPMP